MRNRFEKVVLDKKTGEIIREDFLRKNGAVEKLYIKMHKKTISKIINDISGRNVKLKMLATIIRNMNEKNFLPFGMKTLTKYFLNKHTEKNVYDSVDFLIQKNFIKEISDSEMMVNPEFLCFGSSEKYINTHFIYQNVKKEKTRAGGRKIRGIDEMCKIFSFDTSYGNGNQPVFDVHYAKAKELFFKLLEEVGSKKAIILAALLRSIKDDDRTVIIKHLNVPVNRETVSQLFKYLVTKGILLFAVKGVYLVNPEYISSSKPFKRQKRISELSAFLKNE